MKPLQSIGLTLFIILLYFPANADGFYKWKDARGNTQYGDKPPANSRAERVAMPAITIIEGYGKQWKPLDSDSNKSLEEEPVERQDSSTYSSLKFVAPKSGQSIRANDGDVSAMLSIKPPLKSGHQIAFSLDGADTSKGTQRTSNFSNLPRGSHTVSATIIDANGKVLKTSSVSFNVQRFSQLFKKKVAN